MDPAGGAPLMAAFGTPLITPSAASPAGDRAQAAWLTHLFVVRASASVMHACQRESGRDQFSLGLLTIRAIRAS
jgi:hypothetical protein